MAQSPAFLTRPEIIATYGVAASTHWLASQSAMRMLEIGGNAFDGACAAAFVLYLAEPHMNGPAGDVPIIFQTHDSDQPIVLCGQGPAPMRASIAAFADKGLTHVPGTGLMAATVPGAFDAWMLLLRDYGTLDLATILAPAISYAQNGCPMPQGAFDIISAIAKYTHEHWPATAAIFAPNAKPILPGTLYCNTQLAATWQKIIQQSQHSDRQEQIDKAREIWRTGFIAQAIDEFAKIPHHDITNTHNPGFLSGDDMANFKATYERPVHYTYHGHTIYKCNSWSQGPVLLQTLALLNHTHVANLDTMSAEFVHLLSEAMKLSYADREAFYGDPDFVNVPLDQLLSDPYNEKRAKLIGDHACGDFLPGNPDGRNMQFDMQEFYAASITRQPGDSILNSFGGGEPTTQKLHNGDTCHIDVIDRWGNMVSATPSGGWLQSSPVIAELGFCLGTRLQMSWLDEQSPSHLLAGKRPRTTLTPTLVHRNGRPYMVCGTPGGDQQDQWQLIFLLRHIHANQGLQEAIDMPSWHCEHWPSSFFPRHAYRNRLVIESRFGNHVIKDLQNRGHEVIINDAWSEGRLSAATIDKSVMRCAANPRGMQGYAVGR